MKRNLLYFIVPFKNSIWRWNVEQMKPFLPHFNGRKVLVIAQDERTEKAEEVLKTIACPEADVVTVQNDTKLREAKHFIPALGRLESTEANEATFYAHAKGVSWNVADRPGLLGWIRALWLLNLGCIDLVDGLLSRYAGVGAFRTIHPSPKGGKESWEFSGTFFWLKHSAIFSRGWRTIMEDPYGVEAYPGSQLALEETFDLTEGRWRHYNLYQKAPEVGLCEEWLACLLAKEAGRKAS